MPAESDDAATFPYLINKGFHVCKGNRVKIDCRTVLDVPEVHPADARVVTRDPLHVRFAPGVYPAYAVGEIILVAEHYSFAGSVLQSCQHIDRLRSG